VCAILHNLLLHDFYDTLWTNVVDEGDTNRNPLKTQSPFPSLMKLMEKNLESLLRLEF
jgi:hypothetical protein